VLRLIARVARFLFTATVLVILCPVTAAAVLAGATAWLAGWPPARLYRAAAWSSVIAGIWLVAEALRARTWQATAFASVNLWHQATLWLVHGRVLQSVVVALPPAVPLGLLAGGLGWQRRVRAMAAGAAGRHAFAPATFDARQWNRQARSARGRLTAPGPFPLVTARGTVPAGAVIRTVGVPWAPVLEVPAALFARHMVIVGASGTGKTNLMIRLWAGWLAATLAAARERGKPRPLLVALDCKGGADARAKADRTRRMQQKRRNRKCETRKQALPGTPEFRLANSRNCFT
jgi:hypothetical protein